MKRKRKVKEVRRERVLIPPGMTTREVMRKYELESNAAYKARKQGFFVKNYSKPQVFSVFTHLPT